MKRSKSKASSIELAALLASISSTWGAAQDQPKSRPVLREEPTQEAQEAMKRKAREKRQRRLNRNAKIIAKFNMKKLSGGDC